MKQIGTFPTPYGVTIPIFEDPKDPEEFLFTMEDTALTMGIHDPNKRKLFADEVTRTGKIGVADMLAKYGGHKCPRVALRRPKESVYQTIPSNLSNIPIEKWIDRTMEIPRWRDRAAFFNEVIGHNIQSMKSEPGASMPSFVVGLALAMMLTASLEHIAETEIDCIEAAAFYALTTHDEWRIAGLEWLAPFKATWARDWIAARPAYRRFAKYRRAVDEAEVPLWLTGARA